MGSNLAPLNLLQASTPSSPSARSLLYPKSDGRWYTQSPSQAETPLSMASVRVASDQATTAAAGSPDTVTGLSMAIPGAGTYGFKWVVFWKGVGVGGSAQAGLGYKVNGPSNSAYGASAILQTSNSGGISFWSSKSLTVLDGSTGSGQASSADVVTTQNAPLLLKIEGSFTASASGTLSLLAYVTLDTAGGTTSGTITILTNSFGSLMRGA